MAAELLQDRETYTVRRTHVSEMDNAVYLLTAKASGEQILVDAADDIEALETLIAAGAADASGPAALKLIVTTHAHWDHTRATAELAERTGADVAIGYADAEQLAEERGVTAQRLSHGDRIGVEGVSLEVIALRGHTPGSIALATSDETPVTVFTGDSLFPGGVGNTWGDPARFSQLLADVRERLFDRFADADVYPGHGAETTLAAERPALPEWEERGW